MAAPARSPRRSRAFLAVLGAAQFMVVLDITVVNVALPAMRSDLGLGAAGLHWAVSAYALIFGGFLLAAGRLADLGGRRRVFVAGLLLFGGASLACGLAVDGLTLAAARAVQGLGAALVSPAALAILVEASPEGRERTRAVAAWGAIGALAASSGVVLGGALVELAGWRGVFLVNVPVVAAAAVASPALLPRDGDRLPRRLDAGGAALATGGLVALVAAVSGGAHAGWDRPATLGPLAAGAILLALFAARERRTPDPLVPPEALRSPALAVAGMAGFLHGAMMLGSLLLLTVYMQDVLGMSALAAGVGLLAMRGTSAAWAPLGARLTSALGLRPMMVAGMAGMAGAFVLLARAPAAGSYSSDLLPALLLLGVAVPVLFLTTNLAAIRGAGPGGAGLGSGLLSTAQSVGGALGIAAVSAVMGAGGASGVRAGFLACALLGAAGAAVATTLLRGEAGGARVPAPETR